MIQLYCTYRIYKKFSNPVLGRRKLNQAGFFNLKITTREEVIDLLLFTYQGGQAADYPSTLFEMVKISVSGTDNRMICNGFELVANNLVQKSEKACHLFDRLFLFRNITNNIKGRVERDCLTHSILSVLLARFGLSEYNVARMGNKQSYTLLRKLNRGLYHTS